MIACVITGLVPDPKAKVYAVARDNDGGRCSVLSENGLNRLLSLSPKMKVRQSYKTGRGVNIFRAKIRGSNGEMHIEYHPDDDFVFSLNVNAVRESKLREHFPVGK